MTSDTADFPEKRQRRAQVPVDANYIPTDEERAVFAECSRESLWFRSVPFSMAAVGVTQALITKGILTRSPRFGSIPKLGFAGFCGFLAGQMSYVKTCREKFNRLENSPIAETFRMRKGLPPQTSQGSPSELSNQNTQSESMFQPADHAQTSDYDYNAEQSMQMGRADDFSPPSSAQSYVEEEEPRKKAILYEDLRLKNRENYEVTLTQKAESGIKLSPEREPQRPKKEAKKNIYGDAWEE
ncbi:OCIA domain-containing protein 1-like [Genypterus blacodes]|uniref:OCIA domain-containing protein 1-like n=1 Tax=Genypterus blacodes TaxID=154954 RepID=UPI003F75FE01